MEPIFNQQFFDELTFWSYNFKKVSHRKGVLIDVFEKDGRRWYSHDDYTSPPWNRKHLAYRIRVKPKAEVIKKLRQELVDEWHNPSDTEKASRFQLFRI